MMGDPAAAASAGSSFPPSTPTAAANPTPTPPRAPVAPPVPMLQRGEPPAPQTPVAAPAPPPPQTQNPWGALLASIADKPHAAWIRSFTLQSLEQDVAKLGVRPGERDMLKFVTPERRTTLAQMLGRIVGRPVRVEIESSPAGSQMDRSGALDASRGPRAQDAMALPLVREVMDLFDATIVDVRRADEANAAPSGPVLPPTPGAAAESDEAPIGDDPDYEPDIR